MYQHNFQPIKQYIFNNSGNTEDAEDVFQEGLVTLYGSILEDRFRSESSIDTYLFAICKNLWLKRLNNRNKVIHQEATDFDSPPSYDHHKLMTLLAHINDSCKKLLVAFYYHHHSMTEIKSMFGLKSEQAAKNKKSNCMKHLVQIVREKNLTLDQFIENEY